MVSLEPMQIRMLWYVLAGFVLGFITSTLWEWLYFRKRRLLGHASSAKGAEVTTAWRTDEVYADMVDLHTPHADLPYSDPMYQNTLRADESATRVEDDPSWPLPEYRSPGVFLDSEKGVPRLKPQAAPSFAPASAAPRVTPSDLNPPPTIVLPQPFEQADATGEATLLSERITPSVTVVDGPPPNFIRPVGEQERPAWPAVLPAQTVLEQTVPEQPEGKTLLTPPPPTASDPVAASEPPATVLGSKHIVPRSEGYPDDLTKIQGIGEAYKRRLYAAGIYTWQQVANSPTEQLRNITKAKPNARPDAWKASAQELAQKFNRAEATYEGPLPDDLTKVSGIGPTYADSLYRAGICTYEQLASVTPTELAAILPTPAIGNEFNFSDWIRQAIQLANAKQKNLSLLP